MENVSCGTSYGDNGSGVNTVTHWATCGEITISAKYIGQAFDPDIEVAVERDGGFTDYYTVAEAKAKINPRKVHLLEKCDTLIQAIADGILN